MEEEVTVMMKEEIKIFQLIHVYSYINGVFILITFIGVKLTILVGFQGSFNKNWCFLSCQTNLSVHRPHRFLNYLPGNFGFALVKNSATFVD